MSTSSSFATSSSSSSTTSSLDDLPSGVSTEALLNKSVVLACYMRRQSLHLDMSPLPANASNFSQLELLSAFSALPTLPNGWAIPAKDFPEPVVTCHWTTFSEPSDFMFYLVGTMYMMLALAGLTGNFLVIVTIVR